MSEKIKFNNEDHEHIGSPEFTNEKPQELEKVGESPKDKTEIKEHLSDIRHEIEQEAAPSSEREPILQEDVEEDPRQSPAFISKELKKMALDRTLIRVRKKLPATSKLLSAITHNPTIDKVSETTAKTIGRPSGILGGGIVSLLGTSVYYYMARHYGYSYNFFIYILLIIVGLLLGWGIELCWKIYKKGRMR